jgi:hypothetical protein
VPSSAPASRWAVGERLPTLSDAAIIANYDAVVVRLTELGYLNNASA